MAETNLVTHRQVVGNKVAIIFMHGFMGDVRKTWAHFPDLLSADARIKDWDIYSLGYPSSYWMDVLGIWKANPDIPAIATTLRTAAALPPLQPYGSLILIAHSMGGLAVQRVLVDDNDFAPRVALESRQFHETIRLLEPKRDQLDRSALVQLALAYEGVGRQVDAIQLLERHL